MRHGQTRSRDNANSQSCEINPAELCEYTMFYMVHLTAVYWVLENLCNTQLNTYVCSLLSTQFNYFLDKAGLFSTKVSLTKYQCLN